MRQKPLPPWPSADLSPFFDLSKLRDKSRRRGVAIGKWHIYGLNLRKVLL